MGAQLKALNGAGADLGGLSHFTSQRFQPLEIGVQGVEEADGVAMGRKNPDCEDSE